LVQKSISFLAKKIRKKRKKINQRRRRYVWGGVESKK